MMVEEISGKRVAVVVGGPELQSIIVIGRLENIDRGLILLSDVSYELPGNSCEKSKNLWEAIPLDKVFSIAPET